MKSHNKDLARALRHELTRSEKTLWRELRNRKLGGLKFRRQQPLDPYILDFFCSDKRLVVELDGGQHDIPEEREYDERRTAFLNKQGLVVLRFWNSQVRENLPHVLDVIRHKAGVVAGGREEPPHPGPLPRGERGQCHPAARCGEGPDTVLILMENLG